mmetsp:Transcript_16258/g.41340  ORF Transcript_16258/g.41340 Transcript_16258/m.41340 type:complete len:264 (+) Transcript_16258:1578-2369(+)
MPPIIGARWLSKPPRPPPPPKRSPPSKPPRPPPPKPPPPPMSTSTPAAAAQPTSAPQAVTPPIMPDPGADEAAMVRDEAALGTNAAAFGEALPPQQPGAPAPGVPEDANDPWGTHFDPLLWRSEAAARASAEAEEDYASGRSEDVTSGGVAYEPLPPEAQQFVKPEYLHNVQMKAGSSHPDMALKPVGRTLFWVSSCLVVCGLALAAGLVRSRLWVGSSSRVGCIVCSSGGNGPHHLKYKELRGGQTPISAGGPEHSCAEVDP